MRSLHLALLLLLRACLVPKAAHGRLVPIWIYRAPPTSSPTSSPSYEPSSRPSSKPTANPSSLPSSHPSHRPSSQPTSSPSYQPSYHPSSSPSSEPTSNPSSSPSSQPSYRPSSKPTSSPSISPSSLPSYRPSSHPTSSPSYSPSSLPSYSPSSKPTSSPSYSPSNHPSLRPSSKPTNRPSISPSDHPSLRPSSQPTSQPISQPSSSPSFSPSHSSQPSFSAQPSSEQSSNPPSSLRASNNLVTPGGIPVPSSLGFWLSVGIMALLIFFITSQFAQKAKKRKSGGGDQDVPDNLDEMIDNQLVTYVVQVAQPTPPTPTPTPTPTPPTPTPTPTPPKRKEVEKKKQKKKRRDGEGEKVRDSKVKEHRHRDSRRPEVQKESSKGRNNDDLWKMHVPDVSKLWNDQNDKNRDVLPRRDSYREQDSNDGQDVAVKRNRIIDRKPSRDRRPDDIGDNRKARGRGRSADRYSEREPSPPRNIEDDYDQSSATKTHLSEGERTWFSMFTPARNEDEREDDWRKRTRSSDHKISRDRRPEDLGDDRKRRGRGRSADRYSEREPSPPRNIEDDYDQSSATKTHLSEDERTWFSMFTPARNEDESEDDWRKRTRDHKVSRDRRADDHDGRRRGRGRGRSADRYSEREPSPPRNNEDDYDQSSATQTHLSEDERTWFSMFTPARNEDESEDDWRKRTRDHKVSRGRRADDHDGRTRGRSADRYSEREPSPLKKTHRSKGDRTWFHRFNRNKSEKLSRDRRLDDLDNRRRGRGTDRYHERESSPPRNFDDDSDQSSASKTHRSEGDRTWFSVFTPARNEDEDDSASPSSFDSCSKDESSSSGSYPSLASM
eukprot:scaffold39063_cov128-Skeletonema_dohrnii-CCMP3373.AAC.1